ncbi:ATP-binding cassette domain-containing protein [Streptomyces lividans]|uniref:ABC transporter ATP-binding protein n=4 Tax=Streptomyces TaxID=1883 RepID=A0ABT4P3X9_9ACTN|nr:MULTISPECIES: ABC transporter ATP-binding protein [Streptomyces]QSJ08425.1 ABC transporter [Streptomyces lividans]AIJ12909.1 ABC transporter [Streptomyces lividans TK24]EFD66272.1 ABC transporter [Streptomyces lividans TK24]EOY50793.1 putative ABC transporter ATP-binding protein [Streptomyces lividans 1326]KKD16130.1 ABC transporter [Streptomyces sp. WM6391]
MIQAFGLTSNPRKELPPAVDDVSFEARAGRVTALLGASGAGKTTALRLMLGLQRGRGLTYFRGRPLHRIAHPSREVGVLLGDVPGHPARTVRGHLRMLCAAAGVPVRRADEVLESVGLLGLRDERLGSLSRGMDRRLGLACALVPDPHTLVFDDPAGALSAHDARGLHGALRAHAAQGGTVLFSTADPKEAARSADHVVTLERGRVVADQEAAEFSRTRLRPRVAVRSPHAARLAALVTKEARAARRSVEVVREGGNRLAVYGSTCADIGEAAFRHGILVHQLADEVGDMGAGAGEIPAARQQERRWADGERAPGTGTLSAGRPGPETPGVLLPSPATEGEPLEDGHGDGDGPAPGAVPNRTPGPRQAPAPVSGHGPEAAPSPSAPAPGPSEPASGPSAPAPGPSAPAAGPSALDAAPLRSPRPFRALVPGSARTREATATLPPPISVRSAPSPLRPLRYELRRAVGVRTGFVTGAVVLLVSAVVAVVLARVGHTPQPRLLAAWPRELPLPPAALGAGLLGALAFGDEFRHPALAADRGTVPRRMGLLTAKLLVSAATALLLAALTVGCDAEVLRLFYGPELAQAPADWTALSAGWLGLVIGCAWSGVLAAGVFRSTTAGLAAVVAVPVVVVPLVQKVWEGPSVRTAAGLPMRVREVLLTQWPFGGERYVAEVLRLVAQPVGGAMTLSLTALLCAYLLTTLRSRV